VIIMAVLGMLVAGTLSVILWFEVARSPDLSRGERAAFVVAGLVETFLFLASLLGFVGAIVRKQVFVQIYAYFLYFHFLLNVGVAAWLLYMIVHFSSTAAVKACQDALQNAQTKQQCTGLLKIGLHVYFIVAAIVLVTELYGTIIIARYVNQIQREKRSIRASRIHSSESGYKLIPVPRSPAYASAKSDNLDSRGLLHSPLPHSQASSEGTSHLREFDPYEDLEGPDYRTTHSYPYDGIPLHAADVEGESVGSAIGGGVPAREMDAREREPEEHADARSNQNR